MYHFKQLFRNLIIKKNITEKTQKIERKTVNLKNEDTPELRFLKY